MEKPIIVIPAKHDSKRLRYKNTRIVGTLSLVGHAVFRSMRSMIGSIYVSTDTNEMLSYLYALNKELIGITYVDENWSIPFPIFRDPFFLNEDSRAWEVCLDIVERIDKEATTIIMTLPTSPFCHSVQMQEAYKMFLANDRKPVMSVTKCQFNPDTLCAMKNRELRPLEDEDHGVDWCINNKTANRQAYLSNGAIWVCDVEMLRERRDQYIDGMLGYEMDEISGFDINTKLDLICANAIWREKELVDKEVL